MTQTIDRFRAELDVIRNEAQSAGLYSGWASLHEFYQFKQGYPLLIYGLPYSGKTYFTFQLLMNLSRGYGKKHFVFSPETGRGAEVLETLICIYIGKDVKLLRSKTEPNRYAMTHQEYETAYNFIREHFYIADGQDFGDKITLECFYKEVARVQNGSDFTFDTCLIDPWAEIVMDASDYASSVSQALGMAREHDKNNNMTTIILNHTNQIQPIFDKANQTTYDPVPMPSQMYGGQMWFRRAFTILLVFRPNPVIYQCGEDTTWVFVQKSKPRGYGTKGRATLHWNNAKSRFYDDENTRELNHSESEEPPF
jgi:hypothetical protein